MEYDYTPTSQIPTFDEVEIKTDNDVDRLLIRADHMVQPNGRRSSAFLTAAIGRILKANPHFGVRYCEMRLRALRSSSYLLAVPARLAPPPTVPRDVRTGTRTKYFLWVSVNGPMEAQRDAARLSVDLERNRELLDETGVLMVS